jgi:hypothetical protein
VNIFGHEKLNFEIWDKIMMKNNMGTTRKHKKRRRVGFFWIFALEANGCNCL